MSDGNAKRLLQVEALPGYVPEIGRYLWMMEDMRQNTKEGLCQRNNDDVDADILYVTDKTLPCHFPFSGKRKQRFDQYERNN